MGSELNLKQTLAGMTILVVDDEPALLNLLQRSLSRLGARILVAEHGSQALDVLGREKINVMLCDVHLGSHTCNEFLPQCLAAQAGLKVIVTSGGMDYPEEYPFLPKPYSIGGLVSQLLSTRGGFQSTF